MLDSGEVNSMAEPASLGRVSQAQLFEGASILGHVDIVALEPDGDLARIRSRSFGPVGRRFRRPDLRSIRTGVSAKRSNPQQQRAQGRQL